jgi:integration host factor subunit beta
MTRSELIDALFNDIKPLSLSDSELAVKTIFEAIADALAKGHRVEVRGFGSFSVNRRAPRLGRNPKSGEAVQIPEKKALHFKPGKNLREAMEQIGLGAAALPPDNSTSSTPL